jgi:Cof subfamily protein (haloacid dehalogenase superfamily)
MIKLIITDMDGTFLNNAGSFDHEYFKRVKAKIESNDKVFAICTGKQCERVEGLLGDLYRDVWILGDSATRIKFNGKFIYESLLDNKLGKEIIAALDGIYDDHVVIACTPSGAYIKSNTPINETIVVQQSYSVVNTIDDLYSIDEDFIKITVFDPHKRCMETVNYLEKFKNSAYVIASETAWIDISNYDVHKGTTVKKLQESLNISKQETIAFGDGYNDLELFKEAGITFAMKNGYEEVKEAADFITKTNEENGVLRSIEKLIG